MGKNSKNLMLFVVVCMCIIFGWHYVEQKFWPPPNTLTPQQRKDVSEYIGTLSDFASTADGVGAFARAAVNSQLRQKDGEKQFAELAKAQDDARPKPQPKPAAPKATPEFVELGNQDFFLQVRLTNIGAAVDRVILTHFKHADEM